MTKINRKFFLFLALAALSISAVHAQEQIPFETVAPEDSLPADSPFEVIEKPVEDTPATPSEGDDILIQTTPSDQQPAVAEPVPEETAPSDTPETPVAPEEPEVVFPEGGLEDMPYVQLRSLDKTTARTVTFEAQVGSTVTFGNIFIKAHACRKAPPYEEPESAAFLQIWEDKEGESSWVFSGWMYASSPALSHMDHPVYDVWVLDCLVEKTPESKAEGEEPRDGEGEIEPEKAPVAPQESENLEQPEDLGD